MVRLCSGMFALMIFAGSLSGSQPIWLFDGVTLNGWTTAKGEQVTKGWEVADGAIHLSTSGERGGNIFTDREFDNFDLRFEWKISEGGNSGIKYRVKKFPQKGFLGCEYQILDDDKHRDAQTNKNSTGSLYDVYEPTNKYLNPVGEYNDSRVVVCNNTIQHWLNGRLILTACVGSREWDERIANSKFKDVDGFGKNRIGKIMLTDHNSDVWYRNIVLYDLTSRVYVKHRFGSSRRWRIQGRKTRGNVMHRLRSGLRRH